MEDEQEDGPQYDTLLQEDSRNEEEITFRGESRHSKELEGYSSKRMKIDFITMYFILNALSLGKVCDIVIHSGSWGDVIATTMVDKLHLKVEDHQTSLQAFLA